MFIDEGGSSAYSILGCPAYIQKLFAEGCGLLIEKVFARIDSWLPKHLSFAGRLQLISSDLYSLQVFWYSIFILPKKIIRLCWVGVPSM
jgi:hypothetical protein